MGEPQGWDELPCKYEDVDEVDDDREESDEEAKARLQQERCDSCRQQAEQFGETVDCDLCGVIDDEMEEQIPVPVDELDNPPEDTIPF